MHLQLLEAHLEKGLGQSIGAKSTALEMKQLYQTVVMASQTLPANIVTMQESSANVWMSLACCINVIINNSGLFVLYSQWN